MNIKLGTYVQCSAYWKKVNDGVFIERVEKGQRWWGYIAKEECYIPHGADFDNSLMPEGFDPFVDDFQVKYIPEELLSPCEGAGDVEKTYYKTVEKDFGGYVVAVKDIVVDAYLGVDSTSAYGGGGDSYFIFKLPKTVTKCAVVYYALGKSRLVPLENIEGIGDAE